MTAVLSGGGSHEELRALVVLSGSLKKSGYLKSKPLI